MALWLRDSFTNQDVCGLSLASATNPRAVLRQPTHSQLQPTICNVGIIIFTCFTGLFYIYRFTRAVHLQCVLPELWGEGCFGWGGHIPESNCTINQVSQVIPGTPWNGKSPCAKAPLNFVIWSRMAIAFFLTAKQSWLGKYPEQNWGGKEEMEK